MVEVPSLRSRARSTSTPGRLPGGPASIERSTTSPRGAAATRACRAARGDRLPRRRGSGHRALPGLRLPQPLLLEGEAGVGKTEAAKALAPRSDTPLIRLQCYEGIDASEALYEWNYPRQLLKIRLAEAQGPTSPRTISSAPTTSSAGRCCRRSSTPGRGPPSCSIDELDRADHDFEAFLLELLAEAAVTVPELGTIKATHPPAVVLTSNRTRDLHDALKRRCLYHWIDYPTPEREVEIVRRRVPGAARELAERRRGRASPACARRHPEAARDRRGDRLGRGARLLGAERLDAEAPTARSAPS